MTFGFTLFQIPNQSLLIQSHEKLDGENKNQQDKKGLFY